MGGITPMTPGAVGWVVGGLLVVGGVRLLLRVRRQRRARRAAQVAATWHPSRGPRAQWQEETLLLARACDQLDATVFIPSQRRKAGR